MEQEIIEGNVLVASFMGGIKDKINYRKNNYRFKIPFLIPSIREDSEKIEMRTMYSIHKTALQYHSSFDWQIPVWSKLAHAYRDCAMALDKNESDNIYTKGYLRYCDKYENAIFTNNPLDGFKIIVEMLKWYNQPQSTKILSSL